MVVGPTQTGKTTGLAIPAILEWDDPVLATRVKADLAEHAMARREALCDVWVYDPAQVTSYGCAPWSPLSACHTWVDSMAIASDLAEAAKVAATGTQREAAFWYETAAELLAPCLFVAAHGPGRTMADIARWVNRHERTEVAQILTDLGSPEADAFAGFWRGDTKTINNIFTQLTVLLKVYRDPIIAASATGDGIKPAGLVGGSNTLYVTAPASAQIHLRSLFTTLVADVISTAYGAAARQGGRLDETSTDPRSVRSRNIRYSQTVSQAGAPDDGPSGAGDVAVYRVAHAEAVRALEDQARSVDQIKARGVAFLGLTVPVVSVAAGIVAAGAPLDTWQVAATVVGLVLVAAALVCAYPALRSRTYVFVLSARTILASYAEGDEPASEAETLAWLAWYLDGHRQGNRTELGRARFWSALLSAALVVTAGWWVVLATLVP